MSDTDGPPYPAQLPNNRTNLLASSVAITEASDKFAGFTDSDFDIFAIPDFTGRMAELRAHIKPKLIQLGEILPARLSEAIGQPLYPHVAQHLRRSVNPPIQTWVAFSPEPRSYKPFVHFRVAIGLEQLQLLAFVEDYADEKATFAANLERNAEALGAYFAQHPEIHCFDILNPVPSPTQNREKKPISGHLLNAATLAEFAQRMNRIKGQHARFGIPLDRTHPVNQNGPALIEAIITDLRRLKPLFDCGKPDYIFTP